MAGYKIQLRDEYGNPQYPLTTLSLVVDAKGETAEQLLTRVGSAMTRLSESFTNLNGGKEVAGSIDNKLYLAIKTGQLE